MDLQKQPWLLLFLSLMSSLAWADSPIAIDHGPVKLNDFRMAYHVDESQTLTYEQVRSLSFAQIDNNVSLGTDAKVTWFRLALNNSTGTERRLFVHLPHAYHVRSVELYEEHGGTLLRSENLNLDDTPVSPLMYRGTAVYPLTLAADQPTVLYVRSHSYSHQWFAIEVLDEQASRQALMSAHLDIAVMAGMLLALIFYNGLLYLATSKKENIFYSLYLMSGLLWIALSYGLVANIFNVYGSQVFRLNIALITMPIFLLLFMMTIFDTKKIYPAEHRWLQALIILLSCNVAWGIFDIAAALRPASTIAALITVLTFSVSISLCRKGNPLVKYFLVGHSFFIVFNGIAVLYYKGLIPVSYLSSHGVGIGIVLEALTLAYIISHRIKILEDIRSSQEELKKQASTDPLTKLHNRRFFFTESDYLLQMAKSSRTPMSLLAIDIDHFKSVNDNHGHACGDQVIIALAQTLKQCSRDNDLIARFGGEEFVVLLPHADIQEAQRCAERIRSAAEALEVKVNPDNVVLITVSIGVAEIGVGYEAIEAALGRADRALYEAKNSGRNRVSTDKPTLETLQAV